MGIPRVEVTTRTVLTQGTYVPAQEGYEGAIVIQAQKGTLDPVLCESVSEFLEEFTINGSIPTDQATNTSAYLSAITFLAQSGSPLWVKRAVPVDALFSSALFFDYTTPVSLDTSEGEFTDGDYVDDADPGVVSGTKYTLYGDIPEAYLGVQCYVKVVEGVSDYTVTLWEDEEMTETQIEWDEDWSLVYFLITEYGVSDGVEDINTIGVDNGYSLYAKNPGSWGNSLGVTVEVPRIREDDLSADQIVRFDSSEIPVSEDWAMTDESFPVRFLRADENSVLPAGMDDDTQYNVTGSDSGGTVVDLAQVFEIIDNTATLSTLTDAGSGSMIMAPVGSVVTVEVTTDDDTVLNIAAGSAVDALSDGTKCFVVPKDALPEELSEGSLYYISVDGDDITLSETETGDAISMTAETAGDEFYMYVLLYQEEDINRDSATEATTEQNIPAGTPVVINDTTYWVIKPDDGDEFTISIVADYEDVLTAIEYATLSDFPETAFDITPLNVEDSWENEYETISLDGRVDYVDHTILLNEHEDLNGYQGWVPGELVRFIATSGSTIPGGVTQYSRYRVLPIGGGKVRVGVLSGNVLNDIDDVTAVDFTSVGSGTFAFASGNDSLFDDTFRIKVWKASVSGASTTYSNVETYVCSLYEDMEDEAGRSVYLEDRLDSSGRIGGVASDVSDVPRGTLQLKPVPVLLLLAGGADGGDSEDGTVDSIVLAEALQDLSDPLQYSYNYLLDGGFSGSAFSYYQSALLALAETRKCFAFLSTPEALELEDIPANAIVEYANTVAQTSYGALFGPWQIAIDASSGTREVMAPPDGFVAAKHARIDRARGIGNPVAGVETGGISSFGGRISFTRSELDDMYDARINPLIQVQGVGGTVIWGNRTLLSSATPLAEIHAQKLDNAIVTDLSNLLMRYVNVNITPSVYEAITNSCTSYMNSYVTRGVLNVSDDGSPSFIVICNSSNNSEADKDAGLINVEVAYKPVRSSKYVRLYTTVTPGGVSFETIQLS